MIGCNPSTADSKDDDPTIRKVMQIAKRKNYGGIYMGNLYAFKATDPNMLKATAYFKSSFGDKGLDYVIGPMTDYYLKLMANKAKTVVFAYGNISVSGWWSFVNSAMAKERAKEVFQMMKKKKGRVYAFRLTHAGVPWHPLYLSPMDPLVPFTIY